MALGVAFLTRLSGPVGCSVEVETLVVLVDRGGGITDIFKGCATWTPRDNGMGVTGGKPL